jgi:hypothetical protein
MCLARGVKIKRKTKSRHCGCLGYGPNGGYLASFFPGDIKDIKKRISEVPDRPVSQCDGPHAVEHQAVKWTKGGIIG